LVQGRQRKRTSFTYANTCRFSPDETAMSGHSSSETASESGCQNHWLAEGLIQFSIFCVALRPRAPGRGARARGRAADRAGRKACWPHNRSLAIDQICLLLSARDMTLLLVRRNSEACPLIRLAIIFFLRYKCRLSLPLFIETRTCL
jgi:hypothetical protein